MIGLYDISVPVFGRYLERLDGLVIITAAHAADSGLPEEALLQSRLAPDMLPFEAQVRIAARFPLRALGPLVPRLPDLRFAEAASFAALTAVRFKLRGQGDASALGRIPVALVVF